MLLPRIHLAVSHHKNVKKFSRSSPGEHYRMHTASLRGLPLTGWCPEHLIEKHLCLQTNMYQQGLQLTMLKVLSTTQSVPNAYTINCPNGAIESVCIGAPAPHLLASTAMICSHFNLLHCTR